MIFRAMLPVLASHLEDLITLHRLCSLSVHEVNNVPQTSPLTFQLDKPAPVSSLPDCLPVLCTQN